MAQPEIEGLSFQGALGAGGFADVYLYRQAVLDRLVAVKVLRATGVTDEAVARFVTEANAMAALSHPHVAQVYSVGAAADGRRYIVMGYYPGGSLADKVSQAPLPVSDVLRIGVQLCSAVAAAHGLTPPLLHRDIKPSNVLIDQYGDPVLTDFGVATWLDAPDAREIGVSVGWAAPEVILRTAPVDQRADVYSLGALLWNLLVGRPAFVIPGGDNSVRAVMARTRDLPVPSTGRADVPPALERLLAQAMSKDPGMRPASAEALARALGVIERTEFGSVTPFKVKADKAVRIAPVTSEVPEVRTRLQAAPQVVAQGVVPGRVTVSGPALVGDEKTANQEAAVSEAAVVASPIGRRRLIAIAALIVVAVLVAVAGSLWLTRSGGVEDGTTPSPTPSGSTWQAGVGANLPPGVVIISCVRDGGALDCRWDYANALNTDTYLVKLPDGTEQSVGEPGFTAAAPSPYCIQVKVVRQDGRFPQDWTDPVCG